ncbi:MAG: hypothetical protein JWM56_1144 [Candidatus Peribacteria bacterium]|nr:hypothetical protein [Candidatus Peribacteria bacterium]
MNSNENGRRLSEANEITRTFDVPALLVKSGFIDACKNAMQGSAFKPRIFVNAINENGLEFVLCNEACLVSMEEIDGVYDYIQRDFPDWFPEIVNGNKFMRPIFFARFSQKQEHHLYIDLTETDPLLRRKGIRGAFGNALADASRQQGYKFITSFHNDVHIAQTFINKGRYLLEELREERQSEFSYLHNVDDDDEIFRTVEFLNSHDIEDYMLPERIGTALADKLRFKEFRLGIDLWFQNINSCIEYLTRHPNASLQKEIIGALQSMREIIPAEKKTLLPQFNIDNTNMLIQARIFIQLLKLNYLELFASLSPDFLKEENEILHEAFQEVNENQ